MDEKRNISSGPTATHPHSIAKSPKAKGPPHTAAAIFFGLMALILIGGVYGMIFYAIPADRAKNLEKERVAQAAIRGPEVFMEMLEEIKKLRQELRAGLEMIAQKM